MTDISYVIPIEEEPYKYMKISEIVCSPNLKYVAALYEYGNISLWPIEQPEKIINIGKIHIKRNGKKIFAISDKYISFSIYRDKPYNFKILDSENEKEILLKFPDHQKEIDYLSFIDNGNIIMVNAKYYRAYVFSDKDNISWDCKSMIELKYFKKTYITLKGKLIIFNDTIYEIMMWDVEELSIKTRVLIDWNFTPENIEISNDEKLIVVCSRNKATRETRVYVFSTETGINLSSFTTKLVINRIHLIASRKGERLLYISNDDDYNLMDPYNLKNPIDASELFERHKIQIKEPYIIRSDEISDKIIYTIDGTVLIEELVPDYDNWIYYLRKELNDTNCIISPSKNTIDSINNLIDEYNTDKKEFQGVLLKWGLEIDNKSVSLKIMNKKKKHLDILPSFYPNGKNYVLSCEILENDDFITITRIGVIIWTYKNSGIKMHYYWNYWNNRLEGFEFERIRFKSLLKDWTPGRILPASSYETIYMNLNIKFGKEEKQLFKIFLEDNIKEEFYLTCYGNILMKTFIKFNDDKWIRFLGDSCMNKFVQDNNHFISKISLLCIIFENFKELSENYPTFIASTLSMIGFVVTSNIVIPNSTSSHLSSYGIYYQLSKTSILDTLISRFWNYWIGFYECHTIKLREHVIDTIQNNNPSDYKKPYISKNIKEVLQLPEEEPSLTEIRLNIEDLKNFENRIVRQIKELKKSETSNYKQIENAIKDNYKQIENAIKGLKRNN
ncbi:1976_t:CDS:2 [Cetraspora pellucida]|uniref:1976_t:CDS:1 n=1 Tax=Cetraspora pellucida TaxID=1433469 RepID=A0A9N9AYR5_9GLOM|nr:1976_t:CDS:2 [Cetraspora pellucida]